MFDRTGKILTLIGASPQGVVQFRRITSLFTGDGAVVAYDGQLRRLTTIGPDLAIRSVAALRYRPNFLLDTGRFVVAQQIATPQLIGHPIHLVDPDGQVLRSFGAEGTSFRADRPLRYERVVAPGVAGTVWAVPPGRYVIERWNAVDGTKLGEVVVRSKWFTESDRLNSDERLRPTAVIEALWEKDGYLWVLLRDADTNWQVPSKANVERPLDIDEYDRTFDSVLEVIDINSGEIVATKRFPTALWGRSPSELLVSRRVKDAAEPVQLDVWRARLTPKRRE